MNKLILILSSTCSLLVSSCCTTKVVFSGNGNINTGVVGGSVEVVACTPMEKEVANQIKILSDWYRVNWAQCATTDSSTACRAEVSKAYKEQKQTLIDLLNSMKGKSDAEQESMYDSSLANARILKLN